MFRRTLVAFSAVALLAPVPARAQGRLTGSSPASGAVVAVTPTHIRLEFSESPVLQFTSMRLIDDALAEAPLRDLRVASDSRRAVTMLLTDALHDGVYTVRWKMASADGHSVSGKFTFTVRHPRISAESSLIESVRPGPREPIPQHDRIVRDTLAVGSSEYVAIRWLDYVGIALIFGAVTFRHLVLPRGASRSSKSDFSKPELWRLKFRAAMVGLLAAIALGFVLLLRLGAQWLVVNGNVKVLTLYDLGAMVATTPWGWGWLLQGMGAAIAALGFSLAAMSGRRSGWTVAGAGSVLIAMSPGFGGHAMSASRAMPLAVISDGLHVLAVGGWLGTLAVIVVAAFPVIRRMPPVARGGALKELIDPFSRLALKFVALLTVTGLVAAVLHLASVEALWRPGYGRVLLLKLGVVGLTVLVGAYNWNRIAPLFVHNRGTTRFRSSAQLEVALGAVVLLITAVLVAMDTSPAR